jgi:hypothetical protein
VIAVVGHLKRAGLGLLAQLRSPSAPLALLSRRYLSPFPCSAGGSVNFHVFFVEYLLTQIHLTLLLWEAQMVSTTGGNLMKNLVSLAGVLNRLSSARCFRPLVRYLINKKGR